MGTGKRPFSVKEDCGGDLGCWELVDGREEGLGSCSEYLSKDIQILDLEDLRGEKFLLSQERYALSLNTSPIKL